MRRGDLTDEQRAIRLTGVGASEAAAIVHRSRYATVRDIYNRKVTPEPRAITEEPQFKRGRIVERAVLDWHEEELRLHLERQPTIGTLRHRQFPHVLATPDAIATPALDGSYFPVQAKSHRWSLLSEYGEEGTDAVPDEELIQVTMEMGVVGATVAHLPVLFGGDDFRLYVVNFRPKLFEFVAESIERFWRDCVQARRPPPMNEAQLTKYLSEVFKARKSTVVRRATPETTEHLTRLRKLKAQCKELETEEEIASNQVRSAIGADYGVVADGVGKAVWTGGEPTSETDWRLYAQSLEKLVPEAKRSDARTLRGLYSKETFTPRKLMTYWSKTNDR